MARPATAPSRAARRTPVSVLLALLASLLITAPVGARPVEAERAPTPLADSPSGRYVVLLDEPPLARYAGGIAGLAPTDPQVTGATQLDIGSAASRAYLAFLDTRHASVAAAAGAALARPLETVFRYRVTLNGFAAAMSGAEAAVVQGLPGVDRVIPDEARHLTTDNGPTWIGAPSVWDGSASGTGSKGEGIVAGVLDTGVNHDHPSFAEVGGDGYRHTNPKGRFFGACDPVTGLPFCNDKLIGVYDFTGTTPEDDNGHGSHTASTVAGNVFDAEMITATRTLERRISGVAPHANLITYKVCSGTTAVAIECFLTAILAAVETATIDGVDVINYSIGGTSADPWFWPDATAFLNARNAGVFAAVSAGNEGPGASTIGSPADAPWVLSVGAATHDRALFNSVTGLSGGGSTPPADIVGKSFSAGYGPAPIVYAGDYGFPLCGDGPANDATGEALLNPFPAGTFNGEIVVCDRGTYGRVEKAQNVKEGGAGGFILANDELNGDSLVGDAYPLPGVHITYADGQVLKAWLATGSGHTGSISGTVLDESTFNADETASFSSRGPNPATGDVLKPDVTAPGVDILAAFNTPSGSVGNPPEYGVISGTSMSSPHAAGAGALLRAVHPDWTPAQVQSALMSTAFTAPPGYGAETQPVLEEDGATPADPFDMGAGRIDLRGAAAAGFVLDETADNYQAADPAAGGDPSTINQASLAQDECAGTCVWKRTLTGTAAGSVTWTISASASSMGLSVEPATFTLAPGETISVNVTADVTESGLDAWHFGVVSFTPGDGSVPAAHFPVAAFATVPESDFEAPTLDDPGDETNTTGTYDLTWSNVADEIGYRVQQSTDYAVAFADDAEASMAGRWTTEAFPNGWSESQLQANSGSVSYWSGQTDERTSTLTLAQPISVPAGAEATVTFASYEDTEPDFDFGYVEASADGGETWERFLTVNGFSDGWIERSVTLRGLSGSVLVRLVYDTDMLVSAPLYQGWFVDDVRITVGSWETIRETGADATSFTVSDQASGAYFHRVAGLFDTGGRAATVGPASNVVDIVVERPLPDLQVTAMRADNQRARAGQRVTVTATVTNASDAAAPGSSTEFRLADGTVIGTAATPQIAPGGSVDVSVPWDTRGRSGEQVITATADVAGAVAEANETNNAGRLTVTIRGNKVQNGSFEQPNSEGTAPASWSASSTGAGRTSWSEDGSDGERAATITGTGGNAALSGLPTWTSAPIAVTPGELLTLSASVRTDGVSSAPSIGLAYLGPAGNVLETVGVLTAPLRTEGFAALEKAVQIPAGVTHVRVVLTGFTPTDLRTSGTVTFDDIGLFGG